MVINYVMFFVKLVLILDCLFERNISIFFIKKEKRKGFVGIKLLKFMEESLKAKGVQKIYMGHKLHINLTPILERLGYKQIEKLFTKVI